MSEGRFSDERLRDELAGVAEIADDGRGCPPAERLVLSGRGELSPSANEDVIVHIACCTACAAAWRVARDVASQHAVVPFPEQRVRPVTRWARLGAAAAILIATVSTGVFLLSPDRQTAPVYRAQEDRWLRSEIEEGTAMARDRCLLAWSAGPEGTHYDVRVMTAKLQPLATREGLDRPEFVVPEDALEPLPTGTRILWHVTARLPDGRLVESNTFFAEIE